MLSQRGLALLIAAIVMACGGCETSQKVSRTRTSPRLVAFETCDVLEQRLKANLAEQMRVHLLSLKDGGYGFI